MKVESVGVHLCHTDEMIESPQPFKPLSREVFLWIFSGLDLTYSSRFWCYNKISKAGYFIKNSFNLQDEVPRSGSLICSVVW